MPFAAGPILSYVGAGQYITVGPTEYVGKTEIFRIDPGFPTDLASVPRFFWALLPPNGVYERAAVLHDWFCVHLAKGDCLVSSRDADGIFRRVAAEAGVGFIARWLLWTGVRWGALFNRYRRPGWLRDAPRVITISLVSLFVIGVAVMGLDAFVHALLRALF